MRIIAIVFNLCLIGWLFVVAIYDFITQQRFNDQVIIPILLSIIPIITLIALLGIKDRNWLSLYIKRKMLEEEKKIEELTKQKPDTPKGGN